jgi:hypothetical protein
VEVHRNPADDVMLIRLQVEVVRTNAIMDAFHYPIDANVFSVPAKEPQVNIVVGSNRAQCRAVDGCAYAASADATPVISNIEINVLEFTITGSGLQSEFVPIGTLQVVYRRLWRVVQMMSWDYVLCDLPHYRASQSVNCDIPPKIYLVKLNRVQDAGAARL